MILLLFLLAELSRSLSWINRLLSLKRKWRRLLNLLQGKKNWKSSLDDEEDEFTMEDDVKLDSNFDDDDDDADEFYDDDF